MIRFSDLFSAIAATPWYGDPDCAGGDLGLCSDYAPGEIAMLAWLAHAAPPGPEAFVHLGAGIGAGTVALALGAARRAGERPQGPLIAAYDSFLAPAEPYARALIGPDVAPGDSYFHVFASHIPPSLRPLVEAYVLGAQAAWQDSPVSVLLDEWSVVPSRLPQSAAALRRCGPGSVFVQRRAVFGWLPWVHLLAAQARPALVPLAIAGGARVWGVANALPPEIGMIDPWDGLELDAQLALLDGEIERAETRYLAAMIEMSRALTVFLKGEAGEGLAALTPQAFRRYDEQYVAEQVNQMHAALADFGTGLEMLAYLKAQHP